MRKTITLIMLFAFMLAFTGIREVNAQDVGRYTGPVVYNQAGEVGTSGYNSYERYNATGIQNSVASADDFVVPYGSTWKVSSVYVKGTSTSNINYLQGFNVTIYGDKSRKPDTELYKFYDLKSYFLDAQGVVIFLGTELTLPAGPYWISVQSLSDYTNYTSYNFSWRFLLDNTTAHIGEQPYYKSYRQATLATAPWNPVSTYQKNNFAFSLHTQYNNDLICQMVSPTTGPDLGQETIGIKIFNLGKTAATGFNVSYIVDDNEPVTESFTGSIASLQSAVYGFTAKADLSTIGTHTIKTIVSLAGDQNIINDTAVYTIENQGKVYFANVENGHTITTCEGRYVDAGGFTGNTEAIEATYTVTFKPESNEQRSTLTFTQCELVTSGWFGDTETATLHIYDGEDANAPLIAKVGKITSLTDPVTYTATNGTGALTAVFTEMPWTGYSPGFTANVGCIDAFAHDVAVTSIVYPAADGNFTATDSVTVLLKNFGYTDESTLNVSYAINGGTAVTEAIAAIAAGETHEHTFATKVDLSNQGAYNFVIGVALTNDENEANNTLNKTITNWGTVYNIGAEGIAYDTLVACSGVLTDEGGLSGQSGDDYGWMIGPSYSTILKPENEGSRAQIEFKELSINAGWITIYNGSSWDESKILAQFTNKDIPAQKFYSTDSTGMLFIDYMVPQRGADDGFIAELSCIDILSQDIDVASIESAENIYFVGDSVYVKAKVRNIGTETFGSKIKLLANGVAVDSIETGELVKDSVIFVEFGYLATLTGEVELTVVASDDDGPASNNSLSVTHFFYPQYSLAESFEGTGLPEYWSTNAEAYSYSSVSAVHGEKVINPRDLGYLMTPRLNIKAGDQFSFYYRVDAPGQFVPTAGELQLGWYDYEADTIYRFEQVIEKAPFSFTKFTYDISAAAGHNSVVFLNEIPYGNYFLDMVVGPERYFEAHDIDVRNIVLPSMATAGEITTIDVTIRNLGDENLAAGAYTIELYNAETQALLTSFSGVEISKDATTTVSVEYVFSEAAKTSVYAWVNYEADANLLNNMSDIKATQVNSLSTTYVVSGENDSQSNAYPMSVGNNSSLSQSIYRADTLGRGGDIKSLAWHTNFSVDMTDIHLKVWVAETDSNNFDVAWIPFDAFTLVYDGALEMKAGEGLLFVNFDTLFNYTGEKNLAVMTYQYSANNDNYSQNFKYTSYLWSDKVTRYYTKYTGDIDMAAAPAGYTTGGVPVATFFFEKSGVVNVTVQDAAGNAIENAEVALVKNGAHVNHSTTDNTGKVTLNGVALDFTYSLMVSAEGYEVSMTDDVTITLDTTDLATVTLAMITNPAGLATTVDNAAKSATLSWTGTKAFSSYSVYLDVEIPVATGVTATSYTFTRLTDGMHIGGVQSIYQGGESDIMVDTFYVHYAPIAVEVETNLEKMRADVVWNFEGTSDLFEGYVISVDGTVVDTIVEKVYRVANLTAGEHTFAVAALYTSGISAQTAAKFVLAVAPTNVVASSTAGSFNAVVTWESPAADSYNVYLNNLTTPVATGLTAKTHTLTNLALGTHVVGVSAVYGGVESASTLTTFGVVVGVENSELAAISVYPNPTNGMVTISCPESSNIEIINVAGVKLMEVVANNTTKTIDLSQFESGSYILVVKNNNEVNYLSVQLTK